MQLCRLTAYPRDPDKSLIHKTDDPTLSLPSKQILQPSAFSTPTIKPQQPHRPLQIHLVHHYRPRPGGAKI